MNDNLDDWLHSIGIDTNPDSETSSASPIQQEVPQHSSQEEPTTSNASFDDFFDVLAENAFGDPFHEDAEIVTDEESGYEEVEDEYPIEQDIREVNEDATFEIVQNVNEEDYPENNPDESLEQASIVPAVQEQVSDSVMEAFSAVEEASTTPAPEPLIPYNSQTLLVNDATSRFSGTEWYNEIQKQRIILAGCGGIGSWTVLQLARMSPAALCMYDDDVVEQANMSGQLYCRDDIGKAKVDAMVDMATSYTTMRSIYGIKEKFTTTSEAGDIMICGFDSMEARRTFFNAWHDHVLKKPKEERSKCLYLDGRLSIDTLQVFCITGDDAYSAAKYRDEYLFSDSEADATVCSMKQTTYLACMIGSVIVNLFTNWVANLINPIIPYDLPFFTEYDAQNMIFKTIK